VDESNVELAALAPEEREAMRRDEAFLERLLDTIRERRYSVVA
jgi:hypothetical protein